MFDRSHVNGLAWPESDQTGKACPRNQVNRQLTCAGVGSCGLPSPPLVCVEQLQHGSLLVCNSRIDTWRPSLAARPAAERKGVQDFPCRLAWLLLFSCKESPPTKSVPHAHREVQSS